MIRHIVLLKCKPETSQAEIEQVFAALAALKESISGILAFEAGENNSPEGITRGYTHAFTMDFADEQARDNYLPHPEHEKVKVQIGQILAEGNESVLVVDFSI
jgi:quinol monooxygenase YgiN